MTRTTIPWLNTRQAIVMGILNVTPDSFSDNGAFYDHRMAVARGLEIEREGAGIIDIGGESTRPGATPVSADEEMDRVIPVIEALRRRGLRIPISIDTYKAVVAERALRAGARVINDISGLRRDKNMASVASRHHAGLILMHIRGTPQTMQQLPPVRNIVGSVRRGLNWSLRTALAAGVHKEQIALDPGIGFGKTPEQNFELLAALPRLRRMGYPILVGPSRKSFIRRTIDASIAPDRPVTKTPLASPEQILHGTSAVVAACILGGAQIVRVHDVRVMVAVAAVASRMRNEATR